MRSLLLICSAAIVGCQAREPEPAAEDPQLVAGTVVPPFPTGYRTTSVRPIGGAASTHDALWVSGPEGRGEIWLAKRLRTDSAQGPSWRFLARTPTPRGGVVMFDGCAPSVGPEVPLLVKAELDSVSAAPGAVREAWIMDTLAGAFWPIAPSQVRCVHLDPTA